MGLAGAELALRSKPEVEPVRQVHSPLVRAASLSHGFCLLSRPVSCGDKLAAPNSMAHVVELVAASRQASQYFRESVAKSPRAIKNSTDFDFRKFKVCVIF